MLFLHGTRDPFGTPGEMAALMASLSSATLHVVEGGDHSLVATRTADPQGDSVERAVTRAVSWTRTLTEGRNAR
jgi:predicted alpha/beta-hydrolase family hydrolase